MARPTDRNRGLDESDVETAEWEQTAVLLRDLGADEVLIGKVSTRIDDSDVKGRIAKLRAYAQANPMVVLGALSALIAGGAAAAVAAGRSKKKTGSRSSGTAAKAAPAKKARSSSKKAKASSKRTLIEPHAGDKRYIRRDAKGRIKESVDVGRSLSADARHKSKTKAKSGSGDKGDR